MKVLAGIGCLASFWGIIWGIFLPQFIWLAFGGMVLMGFCLLFMDENE